jgi:hypothetical protein
MKFALQNSSESSSQSPTSFQIPIFPVIAAVELVAHAELVERNRDVLVVPYPGIAPF